MVYYLAHLLRSPAVYLLLGDGWASGRFGPLSFLSGALLIRHEAPSLPLLVENSS